MQSSYKTSQSSFVLLLNFGSKYLLFSTTNIVLITFVRIFLNEISSQF